MLEPGTSYRLVLRFQVGFTGPRQPPTPAVLRPLGDSGRLPQPDRELRGLPRGPAGSLRTSGSACRLGGPGGSSVAPEAVCQLEEAGAFETKHIIKYMETLAGQYISGTLHTLSLLINNNRLPY